MRTLLILMVIALGSDSILNDGAYTKAVWRELSSYVVKLDNSSRDPRVEIERRPAGPADRPESKPEHSVPHDRQ
jgi:hypothetical protein